MSEEAYEPEIQIGKNSYIPGFDPTVKIAGVGTFGCNIIHDFMSQDIGKVLLIAIDTDECWLGFVKAPYQVQLGKVLTKGLGVGGDVDLGRCAALASKNDIKKAVQDADILFMLTGLGGGTGTGAAPVIAEIARDAGVLTIALLTIPLNMQGKPCLERAGNALVALGKVANVTIIIPNEILLSLSESKPATGTFLDIKATSALLYEVVPEIWTGC